MMYIFLSLVIAAGLGLIPATLAKNKGHSFSLWWFYGWMLFIVAIIHVNFIPDLNAQNAVDSSNASRNQVSMNQIGSDKKVIGLADELMKYKELMDQGILTEEEFLKKKEQLQ